MQETNYHCKTFEWVDNFTIRTGMDNSEFFIGAKKEGLLSLANHLINLANDEFPVGYHFHLDEHNSLEESSVMKNMIGYSLILAPLLLRKFAG
jgi:hypothetical protein